MIYNVGAERATTRVTPTGNESDVGAGLVPAQLPAGGTENIATVSNRVSPTKNKGAEGKRN